MPRDLNGIQHPEGSNSSQKHINDVQAHGRVRSATTLIGQSARSAISVDFQGQDSNLDLPHLEVSSLVFLCHV